MKKRTNYTAGDVETFDGDDPFPGDRQFVAALYRGLEILRCFRPTDTALGNQELAQRSGLPKATVSRLTYTLSKLGYLVYIEDSGKYRMGVPVLGLGYACLGGLKIRETAQPYLQALADYGGDGVMTALGGRDDLSMIYIACGRNAGMISLQLNVGSRISLARSGMGRAYLAGITDDERETLMQKLRERAGEERWPQLEDGIRRSIEEIRTRGFCLNIGEWNAQVNSVAVPYRPPQGDLPVLAFNCGGPAYIMPREKLETDLGPRLVDLVNKVAAFGAMGS